ncbi:MAG TPA: GTP cyclohydrolase I FolE [Sulfurovum sp.]|jgi:GTP cyclohydrolase I|nr:MAG: GTP cyclohydrolase I FolE [Sulfurovum sp. 35-42-20]OYY57041.1 MAG: GTP cyclohydrolase I FolE [Sulfurovum sp. 28-43-6]OYZ25568.1 MAG: GTP cyclohydrolase I FolE [Sulfurovum sp. 16-42-52]OYZ49579.1 MAG: GTP cyclohydrolase I FolE [Sulfurovum sp. 24-42-9]OZA45556.1 MAG: GTP cyclohydrolase I FolE [Sulfurovum sp. 17-42-90]OZA59598.1 MAG: GTP cyclohydrolase I FolE [Sulfurovum sp. 39-42-12]HQR74358.1 GTP cyclohydrolase I FolE [Sulfurovum sp.]
MNKEAEFEEAVTKVLELLGEDPTREGLLKTPNRVAKALKFLTEGYAQDPKEILGEALFSTSNDEMVLVRDIEFYSMCEHHMLPIIGRVHVAYIPNGKVVGLSKIPRIVNVFARRLQIQEQMTEQIADAILESIKPKGVAVVVHARHMCMEMRGVQKVNSTTVSSALRGLFKSDERTRNEFYNLINTPAPSHF